MTKLYRSHNAVIMPSIGEGFCLVADEAMMGGLTAFRFKGHGLDNLVGECGKHTIANMLDISGLSSRVRAVLGNREVYRMISEMGRQHVLNGFIEQIVLAAYFKFVGYCQGLSPY